MRTNVRGLSNFALILASRMPDRRLCAETPGPTQASIAAAGRIPTTGARVTMFISGVRVRSMPGANCRRSLVSFAVTNQKESAWSPSRAQQL